MILYLVRHGEALSEVVSPQRALSEKGREDVLRAASFLERAGVRVAEIQHSGKPRAAETAEILARTISCPTVIPRAGISPSDPVKPFLAEIRGRTEDLMVVSHLPFLAKATALLLSGVEELPVLTFQPASMACLVRGGADNQWSLAWMMAPSVLI